MILEKLLIHGRVELELPIGKVVLLSNGSLGEYTVLFPDGSMRSSLEGV